MPRAVARHYGGEPLLYTHMDHWLMDEPGWEKRLAPSPIGSIDCPET